MRAGNNQRPLTPGQGQQSQQDSLAAAAANPALAYAGMPGRWHYTQSSVSLGADIRAFNTAKPSCTEQAWLSIYLGCV